MKMLFHPALMLLLAIILGACAGAASQPVDGKIEPGDKMGDFLITTGDQEDIIYVTTIHCPFDESTGTESCEFTLGKKVNVALGIFDDDPGSGQNLDEIWSDQTYEMVIEGRPVDLQAFGSIDIYHPAAGTIRIWNVVIVTDKPGKITARSSVVAGGDPYDYTAVLTFKAP